MTNLVFCVICGGVESENVVQAASITFVFFVFFFFPSIPGFLIMEVVGHF